MADYAGVLADLKARLNVLDQERDDLEEVIKRMERLAVKAGAIAPTSVPPPSRLAETPIPPLTMPEAVIRFFRSYPRHEPQTTKQVMQGVLAQGIKGGKNVRGHVYNTLDRLSRDDGPYVHHSDGRWSLREWNLGETNTNKLSL